MGGGGKRGGGSSSYVVGHRYYAGLHLALCHGPVDAVTRIIVGERTAWSGSVTSSQTIYVNAPELFGGDSREGGVQGYVEVKMGGPAETVSGYLQQKLGSVIPAFRGVVSIIAQQCQLSAMNPYIKPWSIEARRIPAPAALGSGYINGDANPAHIIYECLNNATWGLGYAASEIDASSFQTAANTLASEQYGLSLLWDREQPLEEFIAEILRHIDGTLYVHPRTGKFVLKLARADYSVSSLMVLDASNILELESFSRPSESELVNQITVRYRDRATDKDAAITVHDLAALELAGGVVSSVDGRLSGYQQWQSGLSGRAGRSQATLGAARQSHADRQPAGLQPQHRRSVQVHLAGVGHRAIGDAGGARVLRHADGRTGAHRVRRGCFRPAVGLLRFPDARPRGCRR